MTVLPSASKIRIFDIGANLTDGMFRGIYHGRTVHPPDLRAVLRRAQNAGIERIMVTAGSLDEAHEALALVDGLREEFPKMLTSTIGVHPTRCSEFETHPQGADHYMEQLLQLARDHQRHGIRAVGEFGLDYDRTQFCSPAIQRRYFEEGFKLVDATGLPLFLHMRDAADDFIEILARNRHRFRHAVVHSFTGTLEEAQRLLAMGLYIGINGCSLKTTANLNVVQALPIDRIMVESDAPWCEIRPTHAGHAYCQTKLRTIAKEKWSIDDPTIGIKSRNEPLAALQVLQVIASLHSSSLEQIAETIYRTTIGVFD